MALTRATTENEIAEVIKNLSQAEKIHRIRHHYDIEEVLEIMGFFEGPGQGLDEEEYAAVEKDNDYIFVLAADNGNFEEAIAYDARFEI